jgi:hypothetical protein
MMSDEAPTLVVRCIPCGWEGPIDDTTLVELTESQGRHKCPDCERTKFAGVTEDE